MRCCKLLGVQALVSTWEAWLPWAIVFLKWICFFDIQPVCTTSSDMMHIACLENTAPSHMSKINWSTNLLHVVKLVAPLDISFSWSDQWLRMVLHSLLRNSITQVNKNSSKNRTANPRPVLRLQRWVWFFSCCSTALIWLFIFWLHFNGNKMCKIGNKTDEFSMKELPTPKETNGNCYWFGLLQI